MNRYHFIVAVSLSFACTLGTAGTLIAASGIERFESQFRVKDATGVPFTAAELGYYLTPVGTVARATGDVSLPPVTELWSMETVGPWESLPPDLPAQGRYGYYKVLVYRTRGEHALDRVAVVITAVAETRDAVIAPDKETVAHVIWLDAPGRGGNVRAAVLRTADSRTAILTLKIDNRIPDTPSIALVYRVNASGSATMIERYFGGVRDMSEVRP